MYKHPRISIKTVDLLASKQNLARCEAKEVTARQGAAGPTAEIQCSRPADYTQIPTGRGYVNQKQLIIRYQFPFQKDGALLCHCRIDS